VVSRSRALRVVTVAAAGAVSAGCVTCALWGGDPRKAVDCRTHEVHFAKAGAGVRNGWDLLYKVPLTPVAVVLDVLASPIEFLFCWDDAEDEPAPSLSPLPDLPDLRNATLRGWWFESDGTLVLSVQLASAPYPCELKWHGVVGAFETRFWLERAWPGPFDGRALDVVESMAIELPSLDSRKAVLHMRQARDLRIECARLEVR